MRDDKAVDELRHIAELLETQNAQITDLQTALATQMTALRTSIDMLTRSINSQGARGSSYSR